MSILRHDKYVVRAPKNHVARRRLQWDIILAWLSIAVTAYIMLAGVVYVVRKIVEML